MRAYGQRWTAALFVLGMAVIAACAPPASAAGADGMAPAAGAGSGEAVSPAAVDDTLREADSLKITDFPRYSRLVDDMTPAGWTSEQHRVKTTEVRDRLLADPRLVAVEIAHGTGVVLCARRPY